MSKCTAKQAVERMAYWDGYCEKASSKYSSRRDKACFELDKGSNNYTYPGYVCGVNGQPWCAATISNAILEACGGDKALAKEVMHGVWPYVNCAQMWNAAPSTHKGRRGAWTPKLGDVIIFTDDGVTRSHTGMVYAVDDKYVYTREGNSGNMCRKRSYLKTSTYIYGYVRPAYAASASDDTPTAGELYGAVCCKDPELHVLSKGTSGPEVKTVQRILYARGIKGADGKEISVDGDFGKNTEAAVKTLQKQLGLTQDGIVGAATWAKMLTKLG